MQNPHRSAHPSWSAAAHPDFPISTARPVHQPQPST